MTKKFDADFVLKVTKLYKLNLLLWRKKSNEIKRQNKNL